MSSRNNGRNTENRDSRGRFGSGNSGRPRGSRNKATEAAAVLLEGEAEALTRKAIGLALNGDITALRLCLERILPVCRDAPVRLNVPEIESSRQAGKVAGEIVTSLFSGELTPAEAAKAMQVMDSYRRILELSEIEERLRVLEEKTDEKNRPSPCKT